MATALAVSQDTLPTEAVEAPKERNVVDSRNVRNDTTVPEEHKRAWNAQPHLRSVVLYTNADFHDEEDVPGGSLAIHSVDAVVQPDSIPASAFQHIVIVPIGDSADKPEGWRDADFEGKEDAIQEAAPQFSENPPLLSRRDADTNFDAEAWSPELGQDDSFAGIFKKVRSNMRDADYFVVVKAGAPRASAQLKEQLIAEGAELTYGRLLADPRVHYVNALAVRNAKRIAYQVARRVGAPVRSVPDVSAYAPSSFAAKPMRAEPTGRRNGGCHQSISSIQPVTYKNEECVGIFHKVRPSRECTRRNVVVGSPYDGISVFNMDNKPLGFAVSLIFTRRYYTARHYSCALWASNTGGQHIIAADIF